MTNAEIVKRLVRCSDCAQRVVKILRTDLTPRCRLCGAVVECHQNDHSYAKETDDDITISLMDSATDAFYAIVTIREAYKAIGLDLDEAAFPREG